MSRIRRSFRVLLLMVAGCWASIAWAGPKGTINVRQVNDGTITIDGDFSDWPLDSFQQPARQPVFPEARDSLSTDAMGDHLVWEPDRVGFFNGTPNCAEGPCGYTNEAPIDFGSTIYFAYDSQSLYLLGVFIDEEVRGDQDLTEFGAQGYLNDGYEFFIDALGDSDDQADEINYPKFDDEEPNLDDFQLTVGVNENFRIPGAPASDLGARQGIERAGEPALMGPWTLPEDENLDEKNGPGGDFRDALDALDGPDIAARAYTDLRAAGAQNPELAAHPDVTFPGYAVEQRVPFGFLREFTPDHDMGFDLFWRDFDFADEPDAGGGSINWSDWAKNTEVQSTPDGLGLFHTANWGQLHFEGVSLWAGDADQDLDFDQLDLVKVQIAAKYLTGQPATWGDGDWNGAPGGSPGNPPTGDGIFNQLDIIAALAPSHYLTGPYAAIQPGGQQGDDQTSVGYDAGTGEVWVDAPAGTELTSINIDSAAGIFTGEAAQNLGGSFDNDADGNIFKATFGGSFGTLSFGKVAQPGLSQQQLLDDLSVVGSLAGGGDLGDVDLIYVPEPSALLLLSLGLLAGLARLRRP